MEIYKWKWMVLGALGCMNNAGFEKHLVNDNIVLDVCVYIFFIVMTKTGVK